MMKPSTFEEAAQLYERMIRKQLKRLCIYRNHDEFYQCGLIALWKAYEQFDERKGAFSTYAFYTVRGYLLGKLNGERRIEERQVMLGPELAETISADEAASDADFFQYLAPLNGRQRLVIEERFYHGKKLTVIAQEHGMTYDQVRSFYRRAIQKIKEYIDEQKLM
ncbi:sigma-70 family RNA polymerase sigma factor [Bacillus sp. OTU530]|uniref:sigma-70 family RNA polymerase sigma factor n=1 Tax=Bacillus sp. OTU530 TaxID=3043862 RepID=UPI00313D03AA